MFSGVQTVWKNLLKVDKIKDTLQKAIKYSFIKENAMR